jgi:hypothetical protein
LCCEQRDDQYRCEAEERRYEALAALSAR